MADGYGLDHAAARLGHAVTALADVRSRMAASMRRAEYWRDEYAGHDLAGLGRSCEQIRAAAEAVHNQADSMITGIGTHTATLATVTDTTAPDQVIATLTPIEQVLAQLATDCLAGTIRCTDLATLITRNLAGGKPEWLHDHAAHAGAHFTHAHAHLTAAAGVVDDAIHHARQAGTDATTIAQSAAAPPSPPISLAAHEGVGGHTMARHVARTDAQLIARKKRFSSTFNDVGAAEIATATNIATNQSKINQWLSTNDARLEITSPMDPADGRIYVRSRQAFESPTKVITVLERTSSTPGGYYILTSYPEM